MDLLDNAQIQEAQGQYLKFLDDKDDKEHYQQVKTMIEKKSQRLIINMGKSDLKIKKVPTFWALTHFSC